ncbi:short chain dehydrogenase/reductase family [Metarhizium album ARSEF 1941]|uniref:Hydroxynaphthalene reductase-like protein Arp2 n=1 Tax=Metarhizium album (strain ARSEF 1941) TaxID=1081103 RepID=A0A0B2WR96_METAS|nr:short chain dehydrogenase/reductase family [Metarhizium album ARSEF 1941]KHN95500.1 short chain dehydrogenase/reductase family [Metarhizium album ARSEF 1941]
MTSLRYNSASLFGVKDIVAVVTGGGSGLGAITTHALVANGAKAVYVLGRRGAALLRTRKNACNPDAVHTIVCDVTSKDNLRAAARLVREQVGYINVLYASSGVIEAATAPPDGSDDIKSLQQKLWKPAVEDFTTTLHVNVTGTFYTAIAFLDLLDEGNKRAAVVAQKSQIVLTSSVSSFARLPFAGFSYSTSKAAVTQLGKMLSTALAPYKIRVNTISPGLFPSEMTQNMTFMQTEGDPREEGAVSPSLVPLERIGTEEEFAGVAVFLASKAGGYLDGAMILLDGGRVGVMPSTY